MAKTDVDQPGQQQPTGALSILHGCALATGLFAAVTILSTGFGILVGFVHGLNAVGGESLDPSQKARLLAEGISAAMNCTALAFLLLIPVAVVIGVWWWRRRGRENSGTDAHGDEPESPAG